MGLCHEDRCRASSRPESQPSAQKLPGRHTIKVQRAGEALLSEIQLAESAKRGYLLTRDSNYLIEFKQSTRAVPRLFTELNDLVADNTEQQARLEALGPVIDDKVDEMDETLELDKQGERVRAIEDRRVRDGLHAVHQDESGQLEIGGA